MDESKIDPQILEFRAEMHRRSRMIIEDIDGKAVNRELVARLLWLTVVSQSNIFLIGDPGTGKTYIAKKIHYTVSIKNFIKEK